MRRFNTTKFEEAFMKIMEKSTKISPAVIIFSYAFYFEKHRYDFHIDIEYNTLPSYNKMLPYGHHLLESDITPELHIALHIGHYTNKANVTPLEQAICYSQIALGMTNILHCYQFRNTTNLLLFVFQKKYRHLKTWCRRGRKRGQCEKLIVERYKKRVKHYQEAGLQYDTTYLNVIQSVAKKKPRHKLL